MSEDIEVVDDMMDAAEVDEGDVGNGWVLS